MQKGDKVKAIADFPPYFKKGATGTIIEKDGSCYLVQFTSGANMTDGQISPSSGNISIIKGAWWENEDKLELDTVHPYKVGDVIQIKNFQEGYESSYDSEHFVVGGLYFVTNINPSSTHPHYLKIATPGMNQWNALTVDDVVGALESIGGIDQMLKSWGWLQFSQAIEKACKLRNFNQGE